MKVASRFLLPLEMLLGIYTLLWGLSGLGFFGDCTLYYSLLALDHNTEWGLALGSVGLAMTLVAALEWFFGRVRIILLPRHASWVSGPFWLISVVELLRAAWWTVQDSWLIAEDSLRRKLAEPHSVYWLVSTRATIAFFMCGVWIAAAAIVIESPSLIAIATLYPAAAVHVLVSIWIYHANLKVKYALDPALPTSTLEFHR